MRNKKKFVNFIIILMFIVGLLILIYPFFSDFYYRIEANEQIVSFDKEKRKLNSEEIKKRMTLAKGYNDGLNNNVSNDPYSQEKIKEGIKEYARMLEINEKIGHIQIPSINIDIPLYAGTSEEVLQKGSGHLEGTSLPIGGNSTHSVLTAHSGLPQAKLFSDLEKLKIGDKFYVHNFSEILAYQVDDISIIEPTDFSKLLIVPGHDYVTLLTCTPISINTHRLLVRGHRVEYVPEVEERIIEENKTNFAYKYLFYLSCVLIFILLIVIFILRNNKSDKNKKNISEINNG